MEWHVEPHPEVTKWLNDLNNDDPESWKSVYAAIFMLSERGPGLGRPLVDTLHGSKINNLKELRPGSQGRTEIRILFAFDPYRQAVLLVAGDKAGEWTKWYRRNIALAEERYFEYLRAVEGDKQ